MSWPTDPRKKDESTVHYGLCHENKDESCVYDEITEADSDMIANHLIFTIG